MIGITWTRSKNMGILYQNNIYLPYFFKIDFDVYCEGKRLWEKIVKKNWFGDERMTIYFEKRK